MNVARTSDEKARRPTNGQTQLVPGGPIRRLAPAELRRIRKRQKATKR